MTNKPLSVDEIGKAHPREAPPTLTREEAFEVLASTAYENAIDAWGESNRNPRLTIEDRVAGAVYNTLHLLQNGNESTVPPFDLIPVAMPEDGKAEVAYVSRGGQEVGCVWPVDPLALASTPHNPVSLTSTYCDVYDRYRDRLAASAQDLFQD
jgi:hypothetical protein